MRLLVCGGRDFDDAACVWDALDRIHKSTPISIVIHGGATGADALAASWAFMRRIDEKPYRVPKWKWSVIGKKAGPLRNQQMIDEGHPDKVLAFPGHRGTADMVKRAIAVGIPVEQIRKETP